MKWYRMLFLYHFLFSGIICANIDKFCKINLFKIILDFFLICDKIKYLDCLRPTNGT